MISRKFILKKDEEFGEVGLAPQWIENANALDGRICAHDMLEHQANDCGPAMGELMALAAVWYIRMNGHWYDPDQSRFSPEENLGSDVRAILEGIAYSGHQIKDPGRTMKLDDDLEETFALIINHGMKQWTENVEFMADDDDDGAEDPFYSFSLPRCELERRFLGWMRKGWRATKLRYKKYHAYDVYLSFEAVKEKADLLIKRLADYADSDIGITISVDIDTKKVYWKASDPEFRYLKYY